MIQDKLLTEKNINWNNFPVVAKRGTAVYKESTGWYIDKNMPILKNDDRQYVDKWIYVGED